MTSLLLHVTALLMLALVIVRDPQRAPPVAILSTAPVEELVTEVDPVDIPLVPVEEHAADNPDPADAVMEAVAGLDEQPTFASAVEALGEDVATVPDLVEPVGFDLPPGDMLVADFGSGGKGQGGDAAGLGAKVAFYGVQATGRRFVFVTDSSGSMGGAPLARLKEELHSAIGGLPVEAEFFVVFFNHGSIPMPSTDCVAASADHKRRYLEWADGVQSDGGTDPSDALRIALELKPSAIFLLTDGVFDPTPTLEVIKRLVQFGKPQINTIAIGERGAEPVLRHIAEATRGTYKFVER